MEIGAYVPNKDDLTQWLDLLKEGGINFVELDAWILPERDEKEVEKLSSDFKERKIKVYSVHAPFGGENDLSIPDKKKREKMHSSVVKVMEKGKILGIEVIVIHPGGVMKKKEIKERLKIFHQSIEKILPLAENYRIKIAVENMPPGHPGTEAEELKEIVKRFNSPYLGVCFDTGHSHIVNNVKDDFEILKEHIFNFHIHDNDGTRDMHLQPPYGSIDWQEFYSLVKNSSYQGPLNLECYPWRGAEPGWAKKEVEWAFEGKMLKVNSPRPSYLRCIKCGHFVFIDKGKPVCYCNPAAHRVPRVSRRRKI